MTTPSGSRYWLRRLVAGGILFAIVATGLVILVGTRGDEPPQLSPPDFPPVQLEAALAGQDAFPFGVYDKKFTSPSDDPRFIPYQEFRAYYQELFQLLADNGLNTLVASYFCPEDVNPDGEQRLEDLLDWAHEQGIRVVVRVNPLGCQGVPRPGHPMYESFLHPAVLAYMYADEPEEDDLVDYKAQYDRLRGAGFTKPIVSSMVLEGVEDGAGLPIDAWKYLDAEVRMGRLYPFRQSDENMFQGEKPLPPSIVETVELTDPATPWWLVYQAFGIDDTDPFWRDPTRAGVTAQMHLALAHGARGLFAYSLQNELPDWVALTDQDLQVTDGKLGAIAALIETLSAHEALLLRHEQGPDAVEVDEEGVEAVARVDPLTGEKYLYVVNLDGREPKQTTVRFVPVSSMQISDIYTGERLEVRPDGSSALVTVELDPGQGRFLALDP